MLDADGSVWSTGYNGYGQFGIGTADTYNVLPTQMKDTKGSILYGVKEIASGTYHTALIKEDNTVWSVGYNGGGYGILGQGKEDSYTTTISQVKEQVEGTDGQKVEKAITDAKHITASGYTTYITRQKTENGEPQGMYVSGYNPYGQLFTKDTTNRKYATPVETDKDILTASTTKNYNNPTGAIADQDGMVYTVGYNGYGQMGNGTVQNLITPWCISKKKINIEKNIINFQKEGEQEKAAFNTTVEFNLIRDDVPNCKYSFKSLDKNVATIDNNGLVTAKEIGTTYVKIIDENNNLSAAVKINVTGEENKTFAKIVGGYNHFVALKADGTVWTWGYNANGELGLEDNTNRTKPTQTNMKNVVDIAAGANHTMVLKKDGTVWETGYNSKGQLGDGTTTSSNTFHKVKLNGDGDYLENIVQIAAENNTSHVLTADGSVYSYGYNYYGQFGNNTTTDESANPYPVKMQKVSNIIQITAGEQHISMLDADGSVWSTGYNGYGQFGIGTADTYNVLPTQMKDTKGSILYGVKEIASGTYHTALIKEDNTVWSVGYNGGGYGILGQGKEDSYTTTIGQAKEQVEGTEGKKVEKAITDAKHITASGYTTYITRQKTENEEPQGMYVSGYNPHGELFTKDTTNRKYATPVETDKDILTASTTKNVTYPNRSNSGS